MRYLVIFGVLLGANVSASDSVSSAYMHANPASFTLSGSYTYFNEQLDVINYLDSLGGGSRPEQYEKSSLALSYRAGDWRPYLAFSEVTGSAVRDRRPFSLKSAASHQTLGVSRYFGAADKGATLSFQVTDIEQDSLDIDCYERSGVVLGGGCEEADFQLIDGDLLLETGERSAFPVLTSSAEAISAQASFNWWNRWSSKPILVGHSVRIIGSEMEHSSYSPLYDLQSNFLLNTPFNGKALGTLIAEFQDDLPQQTPWQEAVIRYDFSASFFLNNWILNGSLGGLYAHRFSFDDPLNRKQYNTNFVATGQIWYQFEHAALFLKGEAFSNYLLGIDPLAYTNKSSRFFEHPYGQISAGFHLTFD